MTALPAPPWPPSRLTTRIRRVGQAGRARRPGTGRRGRRARGLLPLLASVALLVPAAAGCVTVHGAEALIPSAKQSDARAALARFAAVNNKANIRLDSSLNTSIETGALGATDEAGIEALHVNNPAGNPNYQPLRFSHPRFFIPEQVGWPKWFVVETATNHDTNPWLLVFTRNHAGEPWRVSYLISVPASRMPRFATDSSGYAEPVPLAGSDLAVQPGQLSADYAAYLTHGASGSDVFTAGPYTSGLRQQRRIDYPTSPQLVTQFADEAADPGQYPPVALRLANGGALVFFTSHDQMRQTVAHGPIQITDPNMKALLQGTPNTSITLVRIAGQAVTVRPASAAGGSAGAVTFLGRLEGLVTVQGH